MSTGSVPSISSRRTRWTCLGRRWCMQLVELVERLGGALLPNAGAGPRVTGVHLDSRRVGAGDLFVALSGARQQGQHYACDAFLRGAAVVLAPRAIENLPPVVPQWIHADARRVAGLAASLVHDEPACGMFTCA